MATLLVGCLSGSVLPAQDPGTVEVGFFGSQRSVGALRQGSAGALVTIFVSRRVAIETHQDVLSFGASSANGSISAVFAQPMGRSRLHFGPGVRFTASEQTLPIVEPSVLAGLRWTLHDWVGLRADAHVTRLSGGSRSPTSSRPFEVGVFGGFSIRVRG